MRCYWRTSLQGSTVFVVLCLLYKSITYSSHKPSESQVLAGEVIMRQFQSDLIQQFFPNSSVASSPINASASLLAGHRQHGQKYLTVGLSSVKRKNGFYLQDTLQSIFSKSSDEELQEMVVVVLLADFDMDWNRKTLQLLSLQFSAYMLRGQLVVIHLPQERYPPLEGLKQNFKDSPDRVHFRSKQNVDYSYLLSFSANLSRYYIMLEDDVVCARHFFTTIKKFVKTQSASPWVTLEFSKLGYIGKLYHSSDLPRLAQFLLLFYQEMPCDWLLGHFNRLLVQDKPIQFRPSLFQHMGLYSSFRGTENRLKDSEFDENPPEISDNPPANIFTDITAFDHHTPDKAYDGAIGHFWGKSPSAGNHFTVVFQNPTVLDRVLIQTGVPGTRKDVLHYGEVQVGWTLKQTARGPDCGEHHKLGVFTEGKFEHKRIHQTVSKAVSCLKILITQNHRDWVIIQSINIWPKV